MFSRLSPVFFITSVCFFGAALPLAGQQPDRAVLTGRIINQISRQPIENANVFLHGTHCGTTSGEDGSYRLASIRPGIYTLVISVMGYEVYQKRMHFGPGTEQILNISLQTKVLEANPITVTGRVSKTWKKQLKRFTDQFLGPTPSADKCSIVNPEVLSFTQDSLNYLTATAAGPLLIENNALGYRIICVLETFKSSGFAEYHFKGLLGFTELNSDSERQKRRWAKNRLDAYHGSQMHFYRSVLNNCWRDEGFEILHYPRGDINDIGLDYDPSRRVLQSHPDSTASWLFNGYMEIVYTHERDDVQYKMSVEHNRMNWLLYSDEQKESRKNSLYEKYATQKSLLRCLDGWLYILTDGVLDNPDAAEVNLYWAWERLAEWLPREYDPEADNRLVN